MMGILMQFQKQKERIIQNKKILSIIHVYQLLETQEKDRLKTGFQGGYLSAVKTREQGMVSAVKKPGQ